MLNAQLRRRRQNANRSGKKTPNKNKNSNGNANADYDSDCEENTEKKLAKRGLFRMGRQPKLFANRMVVGLTFTVGVAAVAMYAMTSANREPSELFSKFYHLLTYKDFV